MEVLLRSRLDLVCYEFLRALQCRWHSRVICRSIDSIATLRYKLAAYRIHSNAMEAIAASTTRKCFARKRANSDSSHKAQQSKSRWTESTISSSATCLQGCFGSDNLSQIDSKFCFRYQAERYGRVNALAPNGSKIVYSNWLYWLDLVKLVEHSTKGKFGRCRCETWNCSNQSLSWSRFSEVHSYSGWTQFWPEWLLDITSAQKRQAPTTANHGIAYLYILSRTSRIVCDVFVIPYLSSNWT